MILSYFCESHLCNCDSHKRTQALHARMHAHTQPFYGSLDFVPDNPGEPVPEGTFIHSHLSWSSFLFNLRAWESFSTVSLHFFFGLPFGMSPSTSYSIHFFTRSLSSFCSTCPYHCNLFSCNTKIMSSNPNLSLKPLLGTLSCILMPHIHLTILISSRWSATSFSFLTDQVLLPCSILLRTRLLYSLPLTINDISLFVSNGANCLNLFYPVRILVSTAASSSLSTLNMSPK